MGNESYPSPTIYRMRLFAKNCEAAKSRFWYFMSRLHKLKKANGQILSVNEIHEPSPHKVKNFGILLRYDSRSGTHNIYKEFRGTSRADVVSKLYQDMAGRARTRASSIQIMRMQRINPSQARRATVT